MRLLDMTYVATRLRGMATGGAEVDLIFVRGPIARSVQKGTWIGLVIGELD